MKKFEAGQTVYDVGINCLTHKASVRDQKILYVGNLALFVTGIDAVWAHKTETTLLLSAKDGFKPNRVFETNTHTVWTDDRKLAYQYAAQMNEILKMKNNLSKAV